MKSKVTLILIGIVLVAALMGSAFVGGFYWSRTLSTNKPTLITNILPTAKSQSNDDPTAINPVPTAEDITPTDLKTLFKPFWEAWGYAHDQYVDQPVNDVSLMQGAISGMLKALGDKHTSYISPDDLIQDNMSLKGEYEGIGAWVDPQSDYLTIISPMPGSPAEAAGLRPGDKIIAIDGEDMTDIDGSIVLRKVLGPAGSKVILKIVREGAKEPLEFTITRANIIVPSIESKMMDNNIAYIRLITFGKGTEKDLRKALQELISQKPKGLILDLRGNTGGLLQTAIEVCSEFIKDGVVMYEDFGNGFKQEFKSIGTGIATDIPMVVLINEGSASASEIVAGAIQDYQRGKLVGKKSYGKGSVQNWIPLSDEQGAVRITIARWLTPKGRTIHELGIEPDYNVELSEQDFKDKKDPQLDKAIEVLLGVIK